MTRFPVHVVTLVAVAWAFGCALDSELARAPNVLLISIDALRADHLSCAGYDRQTSPFLDGLAARGTRYSHAFVNTHGTPTSHTTMLSSLYQESHLVGTRPGDISRAALSVPGGVEMVQEVLGGNGWMTVAVTGGGYVGEAFGFCRGFDLCTGRERSVEQGAETLLEVLERAPSAERPVFAFFHTYQVHSPYEPPTEYAGLFGEHSGAVEATSEALTALQLDAAKALDRSDFEYLETLYDREIRYTDDTLKRLFDRLEEIGFLNNALVIVTSDHGEEFGDHGGLLHRGTLFDELLRVPLILWGRSVPSGVVDPTLASTVDIAPTILTVAGVDIPPLMEGRDLLGATAPGWEDQRVFSQYGSRLYSVRTPRWKLIYHPKSTNTLLFDLRRDPAERRNLSRRYLDVTENLLAEIEAWRGERPRLELRKGPDVDIPPETLEELRALGYAR